MNLSTYDPSLGHVYPLYLSITTMIACVLGIMFNSLIIIVIVKTKSLHNRCYLLIAYLAAADLVCSVYYTALRILIFNYVYFMTNYDCFVFSFVGLVAMNTQTGLTVMLGIDRLFAVSFPTKYRTIKSKYYIFLLILPVNLFAFGITGYGYADASRDVKVPVCFPPNAYNASARQVWTIANCFIIAIVLILYIAVHYKFKQSQISNNDATIKVASKVIRALYAVILVFIGTWAFTYVVMALTTFVFLKSDVASILEKLLAWPVIINADSNLIMYFWRSPEFRHAVLALIHRKTPTWASRGGGRNSTTLPSNVGTLRRTSTKITS